MSARKAKTNKRLNILMLALVAFASCLVLLTRLAQIILVKQVNNVDLVNYGQTQEMRSSITEARRGTIFDQNGQPIAMDTTSYSVYGILAAPGSDNVIQDPDRTAKVLAKYLKVSQDSLLNQIVTSKAEQIEFGPAGTNLSAATKEAIEKEKLPGIVFVSQTSRIYINDYFASHLIGYSRPTQEKSDLTANILQGQSGIEKTYDDRLSGRKKYRELSEQGIKQDYISGQDLYLTLNSRVQNILEDLTNQVDKTYQPQAINAYLVEVKTGKLVAATQRPTFNLNTRQGIDKQWKNLLVEEAYEPGSTLKILLMAEAYDQHVYTAKESFQSGQIKIYDQTIRDYNQYGWGKIPFEQALPRSSNVGMVLLAQRIGLEKWLKKLDQFGFGHSTQSGLPNEVAGRIEQENKFSQITTSFGQGIATTPIQLLQAFTSIGNNGKMMKIQYVDHIESSQVYQPKELGQVVSADAAQQVLQLMRQAVDQPYGTAQAFKNSQVNIAAKTGTAEIANPNGGGYLSGPNDYYNSVVGFFPAENPKYMLYLSIKQVKQTQGKTGSQILAEIFNPLVDFVMIKQ
ncbi:peptidoglycan D,D-transpeptidase FtsI family protein [Vaginisenegalia massiliensis]|uniref:peptidoglycan D,D-transpeptidase FtsI family protein n=1 Tax=Vaginisenegalia massiliensis TaxID=2058294 RepID=UPI000F52E09A|nr:penicillin-binding protein 2 [Vaginisenegalia massiliensis]